MKHLRIVVLALCVLCLQADAFGQRRGKLEEGDPAPGLDIETWHNGDALAIEEGKVYVVVFAGDEEFVGSVFYQVLIEVLESYEQQEIYAIVVTSKDVSTSSGQGLHKNLRLAQDRRSSSDRAWVRAAEIKSSPSIFIVDRKSNVQWIASADRNEIETFEEILELVQDDRYDAKLIKDAQRYMKPAANARKVRNFRQCFMHLDKIIEMNKRVFARQMLQKFEIMLLDQKDPDAAYDYAESLIEENGDDPNFLSWLTEMIVTDSRIMDEDRDLDIALNAAETAYEAYNKENPHAYALRAMVHYHRDEIMEAIDLQKLAWRIAMPREKDEHWRTLVSYKEAARRSGLLTSTH